MLSRRTLLTGSAALGVYGAAVRRARAASGQFWGAIRWDAWWSPFSSHTAAPQAQGNLWPAKWQFRAPSWATAITPNQLAFTPGQTQMNGEIAAGAASGLKYWAYDFYPASDPLASFMNGLAFHRTSPSASSMPYCLIVQLGHWGGTSGFSVINAAITQLALDSFYFNVSNKPVVYLDWDASAFASAFGSSNASVAASVTDLRNQMTAAGLQTPYFVLLDLFASSTMTAIGADALGTYFHGPSPTSALQSYTSFDTQVQSQWTAEKSTGAPLVITAMTGWDFRPRIEQPLSSQPLKPWFADNVIVVPGTNTQVAAHVQAGVNFINANAAQCPQSLGLIYSWDELDEGGNGLVPTRGDPNGTLLAAVGAVVA